LLLSATVLVQFEVLLPGGRKRYLDYAYPDSMLGLEANSFRHHAGKTAWSRDNTRNAELIAEGWRIMPITDDDLTRKAAQTAEIVRRALSVSA
jgi:very-short-patch-repair endonuclease